jgi:hypothetical protein
MTLYYLTVETAHKTKQWWNYYIVTEMWKRGIPYTDDNVIPLQA